jgi:hypothetical protein
MLESNTTILRMGGEMEQRRTIVPVETANGTQVQVQVTRLGGPEEDVAIADRLPSFDEVGTAIEGLSKSIASSIEKVKPQKASVEFGIEVAVESGQLTALLVKGSGTANITVTLEWGSA